MAASAARVFTPQHLERRRPIWEALSELYLDTDTRPALPTLALALADSGLSTDELHIIWHDELTPVLHGNLLSVAGEWAGFDQAWLEAQIVARRAQPDCRWPPLTRLTRQWRNEMQPYFLTTLALRGELLALPLPERIPRAAAWNWLAHAYFWPDSPGLPEPSLNADWNAIFAALEPIFRPLLTAREPADHHRLHVLALIGSPP